MKKINLMALAFALAICNYGFAQNATASQNYQQSDPRPIEWPMAYSNGVSFPSADNVLDNENNGIPVNLNQLEKAHFESYGEPRPYGTNNFEESIIYTNGPIVDGRYGSNLSILQGDLGLVSMGFTANKSNSSSLADDFVLTDDFDISKIEFYVYQTNETSISITEAYIQIWDGDPSNGGNVIWGDLSTNILDEVAFTDIRRVENTDQSSTKRIIQLVSANTSGLSLDAGSYYVQATFNGTGASGPFLPPITVTDETYTGDAIQFLSSLNDWQPVLDSNLGDPQGLPFNIYGTLANGGDTCGEINPHFEWYFEEGYRVNGEFTTANDITIESGDNFELQSVTIALASEWPVTEVNLVYYEDNNGRPGDQIGSEDLPNIANSTAIGSVFGTTFNVYRLKLEIDYFQFGGEESSQNKYWIGIKDAKNTNDSFVYWAVTSGNNIGEYSRVQDASGSWAEKSPFDGIYLFEGECNDILAVENNEYISMKVYPNPATNKINLTSENPLGKIALYNLLGQEVLQMESESNKAEINISHLPSGTYILKSESLNHSQTHKIIKK